MESVTLSLSPSYVSPLTSRSLSQTSASFAEASQPTPPTDAVQSRLSGNRLRAEAAVSGVARDETSDRTSFLPTATRDLTSIQSFLTAADALAQEAQDTANIGFVQRAFLDDAFQENLTEAQNLALTSEEDDFLLLDNDETVSVVVGSGTEDEDRIQINLLSAQLDDLSAGLSSADLLSDANVSTARTQLEEALDTVQGQINQLGNAEERIGTAQSAQLANISGLNAAFQAQLEYQQALTSSQTDELVGTTSQQIQAYLQIVALDFNEVSAAEASFRVHFDLEA